MLYFKNADSSVQREIEKVLVEEFRKAHQEEFKFDVLDKLGNKKVWLDIENDDYIEPDIYSEEHGIVGEIHTHIGALKSAQKHKVSADILKMLTLEKACGKKLKKYIIVCSEEEKEQLTKSNSHLAFSIKFYNIKVEYYPLTAEHKAMLEDAVKKQNMYGKKLDDE